MTTTQDTSIEKHDIDVANGIAITFHDDDDDDDDSILQEMPSIIIEYFLPMKEEKNGNLFLGATL